MDEKKANTILVSLAVMTHGYSSSHERKLRSIFEEADYSFSHDLIDSENLELRDIMSWGGKSFKIGFELPLKKPATEDQVNKIIEEMQYDIGLSEAAKDQIPEGYRTKILAHKAKYEFQPGSRVWWRDPDANHGTGWYTVVANHGDVITLKDSDLSEVEAFDSELFSYAPSFDELVMDFASAGYTNGFGRQLGDFIVNEIGGALQWTDLTPNQAQEIVRNSMENAAREIMKVIENICDNPVFEEVVSRIKDEPAAVETLLQREPGV